MNFSSKYKHTHQETIQELIETFLDEYGCIESQSEHGGKGGIMESCGVEIRLADEVGELVVVVGDTALTPTTAKLEGCRYVFPPFSVSIYNLLQKLTSAQSTVRITRPELGCRISLDIQTHLHHTSFPFSKTKEIQLILLSLETLPSSAYINSNPSSTPSSPFQSPTPPRPFLDMDTSNEVLDGDGSNKAEIEQDIGTIGFNSGANGLGGSGGKGFSTRDLGGGGVEEKGKGRVWTCLRWKTVRVLGMSFCWGGDFEMNAGGGRHDWADGTAGIGRANGGRRSGCGFGAVGRVLRGLRAGNGNGRDRAVGLSGLESKRGRRRDRSVSGEEEGKPLLV